jgi:hypothetical protein
MSLTASSAASIACCPPAPYMSYHRLPAGSASRVGAPSRSMFASPRYSAWSETTRKSCGRLSCALSPPLEMTTSPRANRYASSGPSLVPVKPASGENVLVPVAPKHPVGNVVVHIGRVLLLGRFHDARSRPPGRRPRRSCRRPGLAPRQTPRSATRRAYGPQARRQCARARFLLIVPSPTGCPVRDEPDEAHCTARSAGHASAEGAVQLGDVLGERHFPKRLSVFTSKS